MRRERPPHPRRRVKRDPPTCRACGARILFAWRPEAGKWLVLDPTPDPDRGDTAVIRRGGRLIATVLIGTQLLEHRDHGTYLHRDHHATCPAAPGFRALVTEERYQ